MAKIIKRKEAEALQRPPVPIPYSVLSSLGRTDGKQLPPGAGPGRYRIPGRKRSSHTIQRDFTIPLISVKGLNDVHFVETQPLGAPAVCYQIVAELTKVIAKVRPDIANIEVYEDMPPQAILRLLLEQYQQITQAENVNMKINDLSMVKKHSNFEFIAWNLYSQDMKYDLYTYDLALCFKHFHTPAVNKLFRMLVSLLHKSSIMYFNRHTFETIEGIEERSEFDRDLFKDEAEANEAFLLAGSYKNGAIAGEIKKLFSRKAFRAITLDMFKQTVKSFRALNKDQKFLKQACQVAIEMVSKKINMHDVDFSELNENNDVMNIEDRFSFIWNGDDYIGKEIHSWYEMSSQSFGIAPFSMGAVNRADNKPFQFIKPSEFPAKMEELCYNLSKSLHGKH